MTRKGAGLRRLLPGLVLLLLLWLPGHAAAHAALLSISPDDGATLDAGPAEVRLRFDEPVGLLALTIAGPLGAVQPVAAPTVVDDVLSAPLPPGLPRGTYLVSWRVTSADSHVVAGTTVFGIGVAPDAAATTTPERWLWPVLVARVAFLAALLLAAGGALFRVVAGVPRTVRRGLVAVAWTGVALAALQIGLRGALMLDAPTLWAAAPWRMGVDTTLALSLGVNAVGLMVCAFGRGVAPGVLGGVLAVAGLPLSGHAGTADPRWVMAPALLLHAAAAAFWVGAFWPLLGVLRGAAPLPAVRRFSRWAAVAVALLLGSGGTLAAVQVGSWAALVGSAYGRWLLLKLAFAAGLLGLAALNRQRLTPALQAGRGAPLRRAIWTELAVAGCVAAVTAVLSLTPPPRAEARARDVAIWTQADGLGALVEIAPARPGANRITVTFDRADQPREVWLELRNREAGVAGLRRPMRLEDGAWVQQGPEIAMQGRWTLRIEALLTEFAETSLTTEVQIR